MGARDLPYKISANGQVHRQGNYFLMTFDSPPHAIEDLREGIYIAIKKNSIQLDPVVFQVYFPSDTSYLIYF